MARSRLEKIGTIFTRANALLNSGAMSWEERPIWFDVYEAFPPKDEPTFGRSAPNMHLKKIFYEEDKIRALFHKNNKQIGVINMLNNRKTATQNFIESYKLLEKQYDGNANPNQLYEESIQLLKKSNELSEHLPENQALGSMFKEAQQSKENIQQSNEIPKINISNLFKDKES